MIYLTSPYTDPDPLVMKTRFLLAEQITAAMLKRQLVVYSPIVHCHELAQRHDMPHDFEFWRSYNFGMLRHASTIHVVAMNGWEDSRGVMAELDFAEQAGIPAYFIEKGHSFWPA